MITEVAWPSVLSMDGSLVSYQVATDDTLSLGRPATTFCTSASNAGSVTDKSSLE